MRFVWLADEFEPTLAMAMARRVDSLRYPSCTLMPSHINNHNHTDDGPPGWKCTTSHNPSSPPSLKALALLQSAASGPYPPSSNKSLKFNLEVVERPPTADQIATILSYLSSSSSSKAGKEKGSNEGMCVCSGIHLNFDAYYSYISFSHWHNSTYPA